MLGVASDCADLEAESSDKAPERPQAAPQRAQAEAPAARTATPAQTVTPAPAAGKDSTVSFERGQVRPVASEARSVSDSAGIYHVCGIPIATSATVRIQLGDYRGVSSALWFPSSGTIRRDLRLGRPATAPAALSISTEHAAYGGRVVSGMQVAGVRIH